MNTLPILPITPVLPQIKAALGNGSAILGAPTGSGKTTLVPLALLDESWLAGRKIIMLEPRRLAARAAAARMSEICGEPIGKTIGYRIRFDTRVSRTTRIEVVTEGILTRMIQSDPGLAGVGLVIFDEFHERSLHADLGLALCLDLIEIKDDLRLLVMSATLEVGPLSRLLGGAQVIEGEGKSHPVTVSHLPPNPSDRTLAATVVRGIEQAWQTAQGDILAFLPGAGEIHETMDRLTGRIPDVDILPLYGELSHADQDRVLRPSRRPNRRIILATPIAETSITIDGIGSVVDSGFCRRPRFNPATGLDRLETVRISRAAAVQRCGRAGRLAPGRCLRLWSQEIDQGLLAFTPPEITTGDLVPVVLELALWGVTGPDELKWLDPPRPGAWDNAKAQLAALGAIDHKGGITAMGRRLAPLPVHPRLGAMLLSAKEIGLGATACLLAALLSERDLIKGRGQSCDLEERVRILNGAATDLPGTVDSRIRRRILGQLGHWHRLLHIKPGEPVQPKAAGLLLAFAYPDRLAILRAGSRRSYQLASGRGATLPDGHLAATPILVAARLDEGTGEARIHLAATVEETALRLHRPELFSKRQRIWWDESAGRVRAIVDELLGRAVLGQRPLSDPDPEEIRAVMLSEIRRQGLGMLPWTEESRQIQARVGFMRGKDGGKWPDIKDAALAADLNWLTPYLAGVTGLAELRRLDMSAVIRSLLPWELLQQLDREAPTHITVPSGSRKRLVYGGAGEPPILGVRLQEMFGLQATPTICRGEVRLTLHLLSPAQRPIQITNDLQSFWQTTYPEVRKELAGRYPKHYWPEDPRLARPTTRTKKAMQRESAKNR